MHITFFKVFNLQACETLDKILLNNKSFGFVVVQFGWITMISRGRVAEPVDVSAVDLVFLVVAMVGLKA